MKLVVRRLYGLRKKSIGLIGRSTIEPVYFQTRWGIHTFCMRKPIDVIVLDNQSYIQKTKQVLLPNHIFLWNPLYKHVIELPTGTIKRLQLRVGKKIDIDYCPPVGAIP